MELPITFTNSLTEVIIPDQKRLNILHITTTDPAGAAYNMVRALNQHTRHRARLITTVPNPAFEFPKDIEDMYDRSEEVEALLEQADVIHFHKIQEDYIITYNFEQGKIEYDLEKYCAGKKIIYHIHGHPYERENVAENADQYKKRDRLVLAATPDLAKMYKPYYGGVQYFPNLVPINDVRYLPRATDKKILASDGSTSMYCVFQSGTNSILKNMHVIRDVMDRVKADIPVFFLHTSPDRIQPQDLVLRHKRIAHLIFDHLEGYYGLSSLEGLSMGKPVIAGLSADTQDAICEFFGIDVPALPWVLGRDEAELERAIRTILNEDVLRRTIGENSRKFMEEVWSDSAVAKRLAAIYQAL